MARTWVNVNVRGKLQVQASLRLLGTLSNTVANQLSRQYANRLVAVARSFAPQSSGRLAERIKVQGAAPRLTVVAKAPYAAPVEFGRQAGAKRPPAARLIAWLKQSGFGDEYITSQKRGSTRAYRTTVKKAKASQAGAYRRAAFVLARSIQAKGIAPVPFMQVAAATVGPEFRAAVIAAEKAAMRRAGSARGRKG